MLQVSLQVEACMFVGVVDSQSFACLTSVWCFIKHMELFLHTGKCLLRSIQVPPKFSSPSPALQLTLEKSVELFLGYWFHLGSHPGLHVVPQTRIHHLQINTGAASHTNKSQIVLLFTDSIRNSAWIKFRLPPISLKISKTHFKSWGVKPVWVLPLQPQFLCQLRATKSCQDMEILS